MKYELKTQSKTVEAHRRWFQNGDHPADNYMAPSSEEGAVVGRFDGVQTGGGFHDSCGNYWVQHGQLEEEEEDGSVMICPGDWILNTPGEDDYHALTAEDFDEKYQPVDDTTEIAIDLLKNEVAFCAKKEKYNRDIALGKQGSDSDYFDAKERVYRAMVLRLGDVIERLEE